MTKRVLTKEELQSLDFNSQSGMEFIGWYVTFPSDNLDNDMVMGMLKECLEKVKNKQVSFPIDCYNNYEDLAYILGAVFADCYVHEFKWQLFFFEELGDYGVVSPDNKFAIQFNVVIYKILLGQQENNVLLGYNMTRGNSFPDTSSEEMVFIS